MADADTGDLTNRTAAGLSLGIIGFGRLAQGYYVPALRALPGALQISVADPLEQSRAAARERLRGVRTYTDYHELLQRERLDAVLVASSPSTHLEVWNEAAARKLPVFMEKPFLLAGELNRIDRTDPAWQRLMVNFNRRFWPPYCRLSQWTRDGSIGRLFHAKFTLKSDISAWSTVSTHRLADGEGGVLYDVGSPVLDLVDMMFNEQPTEIMARQSRSSSLYGQLQLELHYDSDLAVECDLAYGNRNQESVMICGAGGRLRLDNPNYCVWLERQPSALSKSIRGCCNTAVLGYRGVFRGRSMLRYTVHASIAKFIEALGKGAPFSPGFEDALRVATWLEAAMRSAAHGQPVVLGRGVK